MFIRLKFQLLLFLFITTTGIHAQDEQVATLNIGDAAPPLRLRSWLKGTPVKQLEKGKIYIVEFWATWCQPCVAAMPNLSSLAHEYKDRVTVIGIDVYEKKTTSLARVKAFVDSLGQQIDYNVAAEDSNYMAVDWVDALAEPGIPRSFIINKDGKIAWTGHPNQLDQVLPAIVSDTWDINEALAKRNENRRLTILDREVQYLVLPYLYEQYTRNHPFKPDSVLLLLNELVAKEPGLKYAPFVAFHTFAALLHTDLQKGYEYGEAVIVTPSYEEPFWDAVIRSIEIYGDTLKLPTKFYELGAEAWQAKINWIPYPQLANMPRMYKNMANFYWHANEKGKAIEAVQKAIEILKGRKEATPAGIAELESILQQYTKESKGF